jgi:hypothetical protein
VPRSVQIDLEAGVTNRVGGTTLLKLNIFADNKIRFAVARWEHFSVRTHTSQAMSAQVVPSTCSIGMDIAELGIFRKQLGQRILYGRR